jgi:hypothetical protein
MQEYHGQHIGHRWRARRLGLALTWLILLALLAAAAAAVVITAYRAGAGGG